jgi:hypothetical protein
VTDSPPGARGRSARCRLTKCSSCSLRDIASLLFDPFCPVLLVARGLPDGPRGECGRSSPRGPSAGEARMVCFSRCSTGGSGGYFGRSIVNPRIIRLVHADSPPKAPQIAQVLCFLSCASVLLFVWDCS